jgi:hypothetical protein
MLEKDEPRPRLRLIHERSACGEVGDWRGRQHWGTIGSDTDSTSGQEVRKGKPGYSAVAGHSLLFSLILGFVRFATDGQRASSVGCELFGRRGSKEDRGEDHYSMMCGEEGLKVRWAHCSLGVRRAASVSRSFYGSPTRMRIELKCTQRPLGMISSFEFDSVKVIFVPTASKYPSNGFELSSMSNAPAVAMKLMPEVVLLTSVKYMRQCSHVCQLASFPVPNSMCPRCSV